MSSIDTNAPPSATPADTPANDAAVDVTLPTPIVTYVLLAAIVLIFAAEIVFGIGDWSGLLEPGIPTLLAFGGLKYQLVVNDGEWWRLFSAPLLHVDLTHLAFNSIALFLGGRILEPLIGRAWFAALFAIGGVGGALMSLATNSPLVVSVGASGAIMALFATIAVIGFHYDSATRLELLKASLQVLIPSMLPLSGAASGHAVDYGAHLGGALAGAAVGLVLLALWRGAEKPRLSFVAVVVALIGLSGAGVAASALPQTYRTYDLARHLIPNDKTPKSNAEIYEKADALLKAYPRDPRSHFYQSLVQVRAKDLPAAERELRTALAEDDILTNLLDPSFKTHVKAFLSLVLYDSDRQTEAREMAAPACADDSASLHKNVAEAGLCRK